ncbi:MAG: SMI1/KNR4 family protein [Ruminococcus sp.]|nr:SMI1/KNR4 family protein [Ruminococcus sp.]
MPTKETAAFVKSFFEKYYQKLYNESKVLVSLPKVPEEMVAEDGNSDGWKVWKLIPSSVTEEQLSKLEQDLGVRFPDILKAFFTVYHHLFEEPIGRNAIDRPLTGFDHAYNESLVRCGFLPFTWDSQHYFIRCMDLQNMPDEHACPILEIDHEEMFDLIFDAEEKGESVSREAFMKHLRPVADHFYDYLNGVYEGRIE